MVIQNENLFISDHLVFLYYAGTGLFIQNDAFTEQFSLTAHRSLEKIITFNTYCL